jgi:WD40 repeat protein
MSESSASPPTGSFAQSMASSSTSVPSATTAPNTNSIASTSIATSQQPQSQPQQQNQPQPQQASIQIHQSQDKSLTSDKSDKEKSHLLSEKSEKSSGDKFTSAQHHHDDAHHVDVPSIVPTNDDAVESFYGVDPRDRLQELFREVYSIVDALVEENQDLRSRLRHYEPVGALGGASNAANNAKIAKTVAAGRNLLKLKVGRFASKTADNKEYSLVRAYDAAHKDGVLSLDACVWNDNLFVSTSADRTARLVYADGSFPAVLYTGHRAAVNSARFHPAARLVCTAGGDAVCHIWLVPAFRHAAGAGGTTIHKTASRAGAGGARSPTHDHDASVPMSPPRERTRFIGSTNNSIVSVPSTPPSHETFMTDANFGGAGGDDDDRPSGATATTVRAPRLELVGHTSAVMGVDWLRRGVALASADRRGLVAAWDASTGRLISKTTVPSSHASDSGAPLAPNAAAGAASAQAASLLFPQGAVRPLVTHMVGGGEQPLFAVSTTTGDALMWDMRSMDTAAVVLHAHDGACNSSDFVAVDDNLFVTCGDDRVVKVWDLRNTASAKTTIRCTASPARISVANSSGLIAVPCDDKRVRVFDLSGAKRAKMRNEDKQGHRAAVTCAVWSADESVLLSGSWDRSVQAWAAASTAQLP